ncbi:ferroxidase fet3 [Marasmius crinis-equi]|uniref:Ferroxidase fet3 n=1 Tax=Marasmius crinis-equi TaxID=585013 RepID=A0ABR3FRM5_9AGAR
MLSLLLTLLLFNPLTLAAVHEVWWNITYVQNVNPDGLAERRVIGVNNTWPPPPIDVQAPDSLIIHALNSLDKPTSLHLHGISYNSSPWMDGTLGVSECGIPPGGTFDYVIPVNSSNQTGTYWLYALADGQSVDGLRAPLILHPAKETYSYDAEYTVVVSDWYHTEHDTLRAELLSIGNPAGVEPVPDSALIYFAQNQTYLPPIPGRASSSIGFNGDATISFQTGKTYRLRVVNTSAYATFFFWIDGHDMGIIEVDGTDVSETPVDVLSVAVGQRYSVLVTSRGDASSNWAIHANMDSRVFRDIQNNVNPNITSSATYSPSAPFANNQSASQYPLVDDTALNPIQPQSAPVVTKTIELEVTFETLDDGKNYGMFNRITYNAPKVPAIFSELSLGRDATDERAYGPLSFVVERDDVVDLVIKNGDTRAHPFYLHGHKPMLVNHAQDFKSTDPSMNPPLPSNLSNPMRRDTVYVLAGGSSTLRFVADNPGVWVLQSPVAWNLDAGLTLQLIEAPSDAQSLENDIPKQLFDNCATLGIPTSGNAAGHSSADDLAGLTTGPFPQRLGWTPKAIGVMFSCVLAAVLGMASVVWYSFGGDITDEEYEHEAKMKMEAKERKGKLFGMLRPKE